MFVEYQIFNDFKNVHLLTIIKSYDMGFDDFFEDKRKHHGNYREHGYHRGHDDHDYSRHSQERHYPSHGNESHLKMLAILNRIRNNRKLKLMVAMAVIVLLIIAVAVIIALLPLILQRRYGTPQYQVLSLF